MNKKVFSVAKRLVAVALALVMLIMFAACDITNSVVVNSDGSCSITQTVRMTQEEWDSLEANENDLQPGVVHTTEVVDGVTYHVMTATSEYNDLSELEKELVSQEEGSAGFNNVYLSTSSMWFYTETSLSTMFYTYSMSITLPHKVTKTNGILREDGYTVKLNSQGVTYIVTEESTEDWTLSDDVEQTVQDIIYAQTKVAAVKNVSATYSSIGKIKLVWDINDYDRIVIQRSLNGKAYKTIKTINYSDGFTNYYTDKTFTKGAKVRYRIKSYNSVVGKLKPADKYTYSKYVSTLGNKKAKFKVNSYTKKLKVKISSKVKNASGYQYQDNLKGKKIAKGKKVFAGAKVKTITGLKSKKSYYVRVRAYKKVNGQRIYGPWSNAKSIKVK